MLLQIRKKNTMKSIKSNVSSKSYQYNGEIIAWSHKSYDSYIQTKHIKALNIASILLYLVYIS